MRGVMGIRGDMIDYSIQQLMVYRGRRCQTETIDLCAYQYITYRLSYRDKVAMTAERL